MAPRKTKSKPPKSTPPKSKPPGDGSTMDQAEKNARHSTSEKNRLKNIKNGLASMLAMLPLEIRSIPGIEKNQTKILQAFGEVVDKELQRDRDLKAERDMLELHLRNGTIPTPSDDLPNFAFHTPSGILPNFAFPTPADNLPNFDLPLPTPPNTQQNPVCNPASNFDTNQSDNNPGIQPNNLNAPHFSDHQTNNILGFQPTESIAYSFETQQNNGTAGYHPNNCSSFGSNFHQTDNNLGVQTNDMNFDNLDQTSQYDF